MSIVIEKLGKVSKWLDSLGVESKGIHRYSPEERVHNNSIRPYISVVGLWISGCGGLTSMSSYFLGPLLFGLGYKDTLIIGVFGTLLGCLVAAYCSTMGPRSGLRQMCSARYLFGPWMVRVVSLITIIGFLGWSVTNSVLGGEILKWLSGGRLSLSVGIVIVSVVSLVVALFGIDYVMKFEGIVGFAVLIVVILLYIIAGNRYPEYEGLESYGTSLTITGNRISFFTLSYSVTATWGGCAADYYIIFPENVPQIRLFWLTFFGISIPTIFGAVIGMLIGNAAVGYEPWYSTYESKSLGGLLNVVFDRWNGFGKFLLVVFWLSLITNNTINNYSSALSVQLLDDLFFKYVPRWFIVIIIFVITMVCSLVGQNHFSAILSNFLPMLGYWITIYFTLLVEENLIFRSTSLVKLFKKELYETSTNGESQSSQNSIIDDKCQTKDNVSSILNSSLSDSLSYQENLNKNLPPLSSVNSIPYYNFDEWNNKSVQTYGIAATFAFCCGVAGAVVGMNQVYYVGPLAKLIGDYYADLGTFLAMGFTGISYPIIRYAELRYFGK